MGANTFDPYDFDVHFVHRFTKDLPCTFAPIQLHSEKKSFSSHLSKKEAEFISHALLLFTKIIAVKDEYERKTALFTQVTVKILPTVNSRTYLNTSYVPRCGGTKTDLIFTMLFTSGFTILQN